MMQTSQTKTSGFKQPPPPASFGLPSSKPQAIAFNDFMTVRAEQMRGAFKKILRVTGFFHEKSVLGLEFIYQLNTGQTVVTSHNCRHDNMMMGMFKSLAGRKIEHKTIDILEGDYIQTLQSCFDDKRIIYLMIATYRGNTVAFGYPRGNYQVVTNPGFTFGPAKGTYEKKRLNCISFPAATIPDNTMVSFVPMPVVSTVPPVPPPGLMNSIQGGAGLPGSATNIPMVGGPPVMKNPSAQQLPPQQRPLSPNSRVQSQPPPQQQVPPQQQQAPNQQQPRQPSPQPQQSQSSPQMQPQQAPQQPPPQMLSSTIRRLQQQQQIQMNAQLEKQQLLQLKKMDVERNLERQLMMMMQPGNDPQQMADQERQVEKLKKQQADVDKMLQKQAQELNALKMRQAQDMEAARVSQISQKMTQASETKTQMKKSVDRPVLTPNTLTVPGQPPNPQPQPPPTLNKTQSQPPPNLNPPQVVITPPPNPTPSQAQQQQPQQQPPQQQNWGSRGPPPQQPQQPQQPQYGSYQQPPNYAQYPQQPQSQLQYQQQQQQYQKMQYQQQQQYQSGGYTSGSGSGGYQPPTGQGGYQSTATSNPTQ